jgi:uncharacterized cupredoxin-like copper-binding protein
MNRLVLTFSMLAVIAMYSCKESAASKVDADKVELAADRDAQAKNFPVMTFEKREHDFGTIVSGTPQETVFKFTNTGSAPLIITDAKSSCGCTVPEYPKNSPIAPGETGEMVVKFNGSGQNQIIKTVTVTANTQMNTELLRIKAFITPKDGAAASTSGPVAQ